MFKFLLFHFIYGKLFLTITVDKLFCGLQIYIGMYVFYETVFNSAGSIPFKNPCRKINSRTWTVRKCRLNDKKKAKQKLVRQFRFAKFYKILI